MTRFFKLSGAGNDFIALAEPELVPDSQRVRAWCTRGLSAGADGLFVLERAAAGARMTYWNADGTSAALCLNGTRCAAQLAVHLGWCGKELVVETGAGAIPALVVDRTTVALDLAAPESGPTETQLDLEEGPIAGWRVTVGVPHFVVFVTQDLGGSAFAVTAPRLRAHPALGPPGANAHYAAIDGPHGLRLRSWERGVEAETLACGTGALGTVAAGLATGELALPVTVYTAGGFELKIAAARNPAGHWSLAGDARLLFEGAMTPEAECFPRAEPKARERAC